MTTTSDTERQRMREHIRMLEGQIEEMRAEGAARNREAMLQREATMCDKFRMLREERGWSQSELSERLADWGFDFHQTTIAKMEAGKRPLRVAEMWALSHVFKLPPGAVFFMAHSTREFSGMDELMGEIETIDQELVDMQRIWMDSVHQAIDVAGDAQARRNMLVDLMRREAAKDPGQEEMQAAIAWLEQDDERRRREHGHG